MSWLRGGLLVAFAVAVIAADPAERTVVADRANDVVHLRDGRMVVGRIEERRADGAVRISESGQPAVLIESGRIVRIDARGTFAEALAKRGAEAIAARDWSDCSDLLRKATARFIASGKDAAAVRAALVAVAADALAASGPTTLADGPMELCWRAPADIVAAERLSTAGLVRDGSWEPGLEARVRIAEQRGDLSVQRTAITAWLDRQPTNRTANRRLADLAESANDLPLAGEALRKCFDLHNDADAGVRLIQVALRRGDAGEALRVATRLHQDPAVAASGVISVASVLAWQGIAWLAKGDPGKAQALLEQALAEGTDDRVSPLARYNLGLIEWRAGHGDAARLLWKNVWKDAGLPIADLALAVAADRPWSPPAGSSAPLQTLARQQGAILALRMGDGATAQALLADEPQRGLTAELACHAAILVGKGDRVSVQPLQSRTDDESRRWLAYGHLLAGRLDEADLTLDRLPQDDGWTIACRVYLAEQRQDGAAARLWAARLQASRNPPAAYLATVVQEFALADTAEVIDEPFAWSDAAVGLGWTLRNQGTGITLGRADGHLRLSGTQIGTEPTRLTRTLPLARLREVSLSLTTAQLSGGSAGLSVADEAMQQGIDLVVGADGKLRWRTLAGGRPGEWTALATAASPSVGTLRLALVAGGWAAGTGESIERISAPAPTAKTLSAGILGTAPAGSAWSMIVQRFAAEYGDRPAAPGNLTAAGSGSAASGSPAVAK